MSTSRRSFFATEEGVRLAVAEYRPTEAASSIRGPVVLVAGWPQSSLAWRKVVPLLVHSGRTVFTVDPRGFGESSAPESGYELEVVGGEVADFLQTLGPVDLVGHDVGSWICHAVAVQGAHVVRSLVLIDAAIPGVTPEPIGHPSDAANIRSWHFGLNRLPELPEILVRGHEREFLSWLFEHKSSTPGAVEPEALDVYERLLRDRARCHAGFEYYREIFSDDGRVLAARRGAFPLTMPVLTVGARDGVGELLKESFSGLANNLASVVLDCGHYVPEERPRELADELIKFWGTNH